MQSQEMTVSVEQFIKRTVVVRPRGRIDAFQAPLLRDSVEPWLAEGARHLIIDLSQVDFLDSAGMAVLVSTLKRCRQAGGDVKLVWPAAADARRILSLTRFDRVFEMLDSAAAGLDL